MTCPGVLHDMYWSAARHVLECYMTCTGVLHDMYWSATCFCGQEVTNSFVKRKCLSYILVSIQMVLSINPLNAKFNPICNLLTLLGANPIFHVSRISVNFHSSAECFK